MVVWTDGGNGVELEGINVPTQTIEPGGQFNVEVILKNHNGLSIGDPDECGTPETQCTKTLTGPGGYCIRVDVDIEGGASTNTTDCLNFADIYPPKREVWTLSLTVPDESGTYDVTAVGTLAGTGASSSPLQTSITVGTNTVNPDDPDSGGGGGDSNGGDGGNGDGGGNFTDWAVENPVLAGITGVAGIVATRTLIESVVGDEE